MTERPPIDPALFEVICAKEWFEKYGAQMMPGYFEARISAYKRIEKEKYRSRPAPAAPSSERIGSIRKTVYQEDAYLIERVNAGMGEWEYVIQYCGEYYATAPTESIARDIVRRACMSNWANVRR